MSGNLDAEVGEQHLEIIARTCSFEWEAIRPYLGLDLAQEQDISRSNNTYGEKRRVLLVMWKRSRGNAATYSALIAAANKIENKRFADEIKKIAANKEQPFPEPGKNDTECFTPLLTRLNLCRCTSPTPTEYCSKGFILPEVIKA